MSNTDKTPNPAPPIGAEDELPVPPPATSEESPAGLTDEEEEAQAMAELRELWGEDADEDDDFGLGAGWDHMQESRGWR